jgi:hypothetical protein
VAPGRVPSLELTILPDRLAVCRLEPSAATPAWAAPDGTLHAATRTSRELSIVCADAAVPEGVVANRGWRAIAVRGTLDFSLTGILASLAGPLAAADVSIFALSTYDTDYVLVKEDALARAIAALTAAGHRFPEGKP